MIYCNLRGGLGNMLFQIAATKSLAIDKGVDCSFPNLIDNLDYLNRDNQYNPALSHGLEYLRLFQDLKVSDPTQAIETITYPFEFAELTTPSDNFRIDGFFQSEKYFKHNRRAILELFRAPESITNLIWEKYPQVRTRRLTSIHVRRGDYVNHPNHHPVQSLEYYLRAAELVSFTTDFYMVFSDDIPWCKENLGSKLSNVIYIEDEKDYIELYLMGYCFNNIISNSSFSWWGAWLSMTNGHGTVIGPTKWFGPAIQFKTGDILPENWIKI